MSKHDQEKQSKVIRNHAYATKHKQRVCKSCGHRSSRPGRCRVCGGEMKTSHKG